MIVDKLWIQGVTQVKTLYILHKIKNKINYTLL